MHILRPAAHVENYYSTVVWRWQFIAFSLTLCDCKILSATPADWNTSFRSGNLSETEAWSFKHSFVLKYV